jgi:hypothetical protein
MPSLLPVYTCFVVYLCAVMNLLHYVSCVDLECAGAWMPLCPCLVPLCQPISYVPWAWETCNSVLPTICLLPALPLFYYLPHLSSTFYVCLQPVRCQTSGMHWSATCLFCAPMQYLLHLLQTYCLSFWEVGVGGGGVCLPGAWKHAACLAAVSHSSPACLLCICVCLLILLYGGYAAGGFWVQWA